MWRIKDGRQGKAAAIFIYTRETESSLSPKDLSILFRVIPGLLHGCSLCLYTFVVSQASIIHNHACTESIISLSIYPQIQMYDSEDI